MLTFADLIPVRGRSPWLPSSSVYIYISTTVYKQLYCYLTCETARLRRWQTQWTKTVYGLSFVMSAFNPLRSLAIAAAPSDPRPIICRNINRVWIIQQQCCETLINIQFSNFHYSYQCVFVCERMFTCVCNNLVGGDSIGRHHFLHDFVHCHWFPVTNLKTIEAKSYIRVLKLRVLHNHIDLTY